MNTKLKTSNAFIAASWVCLCAGFLAYIVGLSNATMQLNEKGYYFTLLIYGLFSAVSLQKSVRDKVEGIEVSSLYFGLCWASLFASSFLLSVGLWNAVLTLSEKGFYGMSFLLCLFASIAVQKNTRDSKLDTKPKKAGNKENSSGDFFRSKTE